MGPLSVHGRYVVPSKYQSVGTLSVHSRYIVGTSSIHRRYIVGTSSVQRRYIGCTWLVSGTYEIVASRYICVIESCHSYTSARVSLPVSRRLIFTS